MQTKDLTGPDLDYWVAMANAKGSNQEPNVLRRHYGSDCCGDPSDEQSKRQFVDSKIGSTLPDRIHWQ